jgi:hypothetical protein
VPELVRDDAGVLDAQAVVPARIAHHTDEGDAPEAELRARRPDDEVRDVTRDVRLVRAPFLGELIEQISSARRRVVRRRAHDVGRDRVGDLHVARVGNVDLVHQCVERGDRVGHGTVV